VTGNGTGSGKGTGGPAAKDDPKLIFGITDRACQFMEKQSQAGNPFYLQVSHYAVHLDIFYRAQTLDQVEQRQAGRKHNMPQFAAMTADLDTGIGLLMKKVKSLGLLDNTYIFFLSDNGGRNTLRKSPREKVPRNAPLRDGKGSVYEGGVRVPFVVLGPDIKAGSVSHVPVTGLDIMPTLAALAGYRQPMPPNVDGGSIVNVLRQEGEGTVKRLNP
ncbi:MAG: sulfatase-like hydrolase/transferase, partial [Planctomycetaceae bacterium]|nr:sulfatase-like hydrolase/transferase [Planctomycetaceae bacterium]